MTEETWRRQDPGQCGLLWDIFLYGFRIGVEYNPFCWKGWGRGGLLWVYPFP